MRSSLTQGSVLPRLLRLRRKLDPAALPLALLLGGLLAGGCSEPAGESATHEAGTTPAASVDETSPPAAAPVPDPTAASGSDPAALPGSDPAIALAADLVICTIPDPAVPSSAFEIFTSPASDSGDYWVRYSCKETCVDWRECQAPAHLADGGEPIMHGRAPDRPKPALAFVVDGMGGHLVFSEDGAATVIIHAGAGGTRYYAEVADAIEKQSNARTALVRWEQGFVGNVVRPPFPAPVQWGWFSRTSPDATTLRSLSRRVAGVLAWTHANLAGDNAFGTMGCSMGTNATFMPVLWHGLDPIIDYQLFVGGPNMWDLNAQCGLRTYTKGHCDRDGTTPCAADGDCAALGPEAKCTKPGPYTGINALFDQFANHVHVTEACDILAAGSAAAPHPAFDDSSMGFVGEAHWNVDHRVDFLVNIGRLTGEGGIGGDEHWALGDFAYVFNRIEPAANRAWHVYPDSHHCDAMTSGAAVDLVIQRMGL